MLQVIVSLLIFPLILLGQNGTQMKFDHEQFDLGEIREGESADHIFNFTNQGEDTLRIINVYGS